MNTLRKMVKNNKGATAIEYGLIAALVAVAAIAARLATQAVRQVDETEHRLQQMVAVGTAADDMQEQVDLGRRRPFAIPVSHWRSSR